MRTTRLVIFNSKQLPARSWFANWQKNSKVQNYWKQSSL